MEATLNKVLDLSRRKHSKPRRRHTFLFALVLLPLIVFTSPSLPENHPVEEAFGPIGLFLVVICVLGRSYSSLFVAGKKNKQVVNEGMYSIVRNPLYVFSFLGVIGMGFQSGRVIILAVMVCWFVSYYRWVVAKEEIYLTKKFGDEYKEYCANTPRWIPQFSKWYLPEFVTVRPSMVQRTMTDALMFCIPLALFELIEVLQANAIIKSYFSIL